MKTPAAIAHLIDACIDDKRMLEHESRAVHGHRRLVLERLTNEQARMVDRLKALGQADARPHRGSAIELGRELGRTLRGLLGCSTSGDAVHACRRSCRRAEARFDEALQLPWPQATFAVLTEERARLGAAADALVAIQY
jgi:hypothetical protein